MAAYYEDIRGILQETAEDLELDDNHQGHGLVRADRAVAADVEEEGYGVKVTAPEDAEETEAGNYTYIYTVENTGSEYDTYDLSVESTDDNFIVDVQEEISVISGESVDVEVEVEVTNDAEGGDSAEITLTAESQESDVSDDVSDSDSMVVTLIGEPEVETNDAYNVTDTSAVLEGNLTDLGGADSVEVWFKWSADETDLDNAEETGRLTLKEPGTFEDTIDDLDPNTTYYFQALVANDAGFGEGAVLEFTTDKKGDDEDTAKPVIEKFEVSTRTSGPWNRADVEWEVSHEDGALLEVTSELLVIDADGEEVVDIETTSVSGDSASGEHSLRTREDADSVRLTVTDTEGQKTSKTKNIEF